MGDAHLEYIANIASTFSTNELLTRFYLQSLARDLLPSEKVRHCMRTIAPYKTNVEIAKRGGNNNAHYRNLIICSRIWQCPVCAATITENRRKELTKAIATSGLHPVLISFTLQHNKTHKLTDSLKALLDAYRAYKSGRGWQKFAHEYFCVGSVKALEVTYGENGWHCHIHELALFEIPITANVENAINTFVKERWQRSVVAQGRDASWTRGADVRTEQHEIREYVAKFGKLPRGTKWTVEHELTKSPSKKGRIGGATPMQLLIDYGAGDTKSGQLFIEYVGAFKGKHQLQWSKGLRDMLGLGVELTDAELSEREAAKGVILATLTRAQWKVILSSGRRGELLAVASSADNETLIQYIASIIDPHTAESPA